MGLVGRLGSALSAANGSARLAVRLPSNARALTFLASMPDPQDPAFPEAGRRPAAHAPSPSPGAAPSCSSPRCATCGQCTRSSRTSCPGKCCSRAKPRRPAAQAFRQRPASLFASQSFWEGVDVPGEALSLVVIDKLPFASPGEPIVASADRPPARQRSGRLLRLSAAASGAGPEAGLWQAHPRGYDRGIVAVLDGRMTRKAYGRVSSSPSPAAASCAARRMQRISGRWGRTARCDRGLAPRTSRPASGSLLASCCVREKLLAVNVLSRADRGRSAGTAQRPVGPK